MPAKANPKEQKEFVDNVLMPLIAKAKDGAVELFFMDASHFVMGGFPGRVWSLVRRYIKTASGRKRYNVLGALNYATKRMERVCNETYITSAQCRKLKMTGRIEKFVGYKLSAYPNSMTYHFCVLVLTQIDGQNNE